MELEGGRKKDGTEKIKELTTEDLKKKMQKLERIFEKEKKESERIIDLKQKDNSRLTEEGKKRKIRLEIKRTLEQKWELARWVAKQLGDNENELQSLLKDLKSTEDEELYEWKKLERFEKINKIRRENLAKENAVDKLQKKEKSKILQSTESKPITTPSTQTISGASSANCAQEEYQGEMSNQKSTMAFHRNNFEQKFGPIASSGRGAKTRSRAPPI